MEKETPKTLDPATPAKSLSLPVIALVVLVALVVGWCIGYYTGKYQDSRLNGRQANNKSRRDSQTQISVPPSGGRDQQEQAEVVPGLPTESRRNDAQGNEEPVILGKLPVGGEGEIGTDANTNSDDSQISSDTNEPSNSNNATNDAGNDADNDPLQKDILYLYSVYEGTWESDSGNINQFALLGEDGGNNSYTVLRYFVPTASEYTASLTLSPNKRKIVFQESDGTHIFDLMGRENVLITTNNYASPFYPSWSYDSKYLAFKANSDGATWQLYSLENETFADTGLGGEYFAWASNSLDYAILDGENLYRGSVGGSPTTLASGLDSYHGEVFWSPSGNYLVLGPYLDKLINAQTGEEYPLLINGERAYLYDSIQGPVWVEEDSAGLWVLAYSAKDPTKTHPAKLYIANLLPALNGQDIDYREIFMADQGDPNQYITQVTIGNLQGWDGNDYYGAYISSNSPGGGVWKLTDVSGYLTNGKASIQKLDIPSLPHFFAPLNLAIPVFPRN